MCWLLPLGRRALRGPDAPISLLVSLPPPRVAQLPTIHVMEMRHERDIPYAITFDIFRYRSLIEDSVGAT